MRQIHANLVEFQGCGLLIVGDHGSGKTRLTAALVGHGGKFVADDSVLLEITESGTFGRAPARTRGLIEIDGELTAATDAFGACSVIDKARITHLMDLDRRSVSLYGR